MLTIEFLIFYCCLDIIFPSIRWWSWDLGVLLLSNNNLIMWLCGRVAVCNWFLLLNFCKWRCIVRCSLHWDRSLQNRLGDKWTCGTTLASAYVLHYLSATWLQLQIMKRSPRWEWVLIGMLLLNTKDWVQ